MSANKRLALDPALLERLRRLAEARCGGADPAHDFLHVIRVAENARRIGEAEGTEADIAVAAAYLHELFNHPKGHPEAHRSGEVCAEHAKSALEMEGCPEECIEPICYAIRVHPFSLGIVPTTPEARVLQDADRLDAIGAIGAARCFATTATMGRPFYHPDDPFCRRREPDDKRWAVDHFFRKLLRIPGRMNTATGRAIAEERVRFLSVFLVQLEREIRGE